ncbi:MAG: GTPase HflX [Opitutae bacterium]|nr:GTPase HflX [Opitutae bacterium]
MFEVREKPKRVERAFLVSVVRRKEEQDQAESLLEELAELTDNLGIKVMGRVIARARRAYARFTLGKGKVQEIIDLAQASACDVIVFDNALSPSQQRNWETESNMLVIDRHEIIIDVFAERARTREAVLQVELARMEYSLPRLKRAWTHLDRQRGGGVTQRGEGEAQIELDQRMLRTKISSLRKELLEVEKRRGIQRSKREKVPVPMAALAGYTNAGKSTLLNKLTGSEVFVADKLFATLDPTSRRLKLPSGRPLVLTDTVGFVRNLPHRLVDAFKATLEEALVSDFLLQVIDLSSCEVEEQMETTSRVLVELGADEKHKYLVFNKLDLADPALVKALRIRWPDAFFVSAVTGQGLDDLLAECDLYLARHLDEREYLIPHDRYDLVARLRRAGAIMEEDPRDDGVFLRVSVPESMQRSLRAFLVK